MARDDSSTARGRSRVSRTGSLATPAAANSSWISRQTGCLAGFGPVLARLVLGVDRRQPDDPRTAAGRDLDGLRVQPADAGVERDRPERVDARHGAAHDGRALRGRRVVRLEHEARQPELGEAAGEREIVDAPLREVGLDVDVEVVGRRGRARARAADGSVTCAAGKKHVLLGHGRRSLDVEGRDRLHPPGLALRALRLRPDDRLVVRARRSGSRRRRPRRGCRPARRCRGRTSAGWRACAGPTPSRSRARGRCPRRAARPRAGRRSRRCGGAGRASGSGRACR